MKILYKTLTELFPIPKNDYESLYTNLAAVEISIFLQLKRKQKCIIDVSQDRTIELWEVGMSVVERLATPNGDYSSVMVTW